MILSVDPCEPAPTEIFQAATALLAGRLVAFPTETVYGLGANALDAVAVRKIFAAKGRVANNPIIVHVADMAAATQLVTDWPTAAQALAMQFWPGPLTLVLPKRPEIPDVVTGGGPNVGVRVPGHPVALALLRSARVPIAAPSANASLHISPTTAQHVLRSLGDRVELILDAGPCSGGLESTVVDLTASPPRVLRPGLVTLDALRAIVPEMAPSSAAAGDAACTGSAALPAPGQLARHYAPSVPLELVDAQARTVVDARLASGQRVGWLCFGPPSGQGHPRLTIVEMPGVAAQYAARLYAALHQLDDGCVDRIVVTLPPLDEPWRAVHDRLRRAAAR